MRAFFDPWKLQDTTALDLGTSVNYNATLQPRQALMQQANPASSKRRRLRQARRIAQHCFVAINFLTLSLKACHRNNERILGLGANRMQKQVHS